MNKIKWIFVDLDGTLVDSLNFMYQAYLEFLEAQGCVGNKKEFNQLNGPSIKEIVVSLKEKYDLNDDLDILYRKYEDKVSFFYKHNIAPIEKRISFLYSLKKQNYKLALVTSSTKKIVDIFILKNNLQNLFSMIITSDDVVNSKPHPDIYKLCLQKTMAKTNEVIALEDSDHGIDSATKAGLRCIKIINDQSFEQLHSSLVS